MSPRGVLFKMKSDPRVTRIGKFLRSTSLDELPQLFNVLQAHMSLRVRVRFSYAIVTWRSKLMEHFC